MTTAFDFKIILAVNDLQTGSAGSENNLDDVDTVPPGNIPIAPPCDKCLRAFFLVSKFSSIASRSFLNEIAYELQIRINNILNNISNNNNRFYRII